MGKLLPLALFSTLLSAAPPVDSPELRRAALHAIFPEAVVEPNGFPKFDHSEHGKLEFPDAFRDESPFSVRGAVDAAERKLAVDAKTGQKSINRRVRFQLFEVQPGSLYAAVLQLDFPDVKPDMYAAQLRVALLTRNGDRFSVHDRRVVDYPNVRTVNHAEIIDLCGKPALLVEYQTGRNAALALWTEEKNHLRPLISTLTTGIWWFESPHMMTRRTLDLKRTREANCARFVFHGAK